MYKTETVDVYEDFSINKEMFVFSNHLTKSKYCDNSNKLVIGKIKDETGGVPIEEFVGLKPRIYFFFLVDDSSEHEKAIILITIYKTFFCQTFCFNIQSN